MFVQRLNGPAARVMLSIVAGVAGVRRRARRADHHQQLAVGRELADRVVAVVDAEERAVGRDRQTVSPRREHALRERGDEAAVRLEDQHLRVESRQDVDAVLRIDWTPTTSLCE